VRGLGDAAGAEHLGDLLVPLHDADLAQCFPARREVANPEREARDRVQVTALVQQPLALKGATTVLKVRFETCSTRGMSTLFAAEFIAYGTALVP